MDSPSRERGFLWRCCSGLGVGLRPRGDLGPRAGGGGAGGPRGVVGWPSGLTSPWPTLHTGWPSFVLGWRETRTLIEGRRMIMMIIAIITTITTTIIMDSYIALSRQNVPYSQIQTHTYAYTYTHTYIHVSVCLSLSLPLSTHTHTHKYMYKHMHTCVYYMTISTHMVESAQHSIVPSANHHEVNTYYFQSVVEGWYYHNLTPCPLLSRPPSSQHLLFPVWNPGLVPSHHYNNSSTQQTSMKSTPTVSRLRSGTITTRHHSLYSADHYHINSYSFQTGVDGWYHHNTALLPLLSRPPWSQHLFSVWGWRLILLQH